MLKPIIRKSARPQDLVENPVVDQWLQERRREAAIEAQREKEWQKQLEDEGLLHKRTQLSPTHPKLILVREEYMNAEWVNAALHVQAVQNQIKSNERLVLIALCGHISKTDSFSFVGRSKLEKETGLAESTVRKAIKGLERKRILRVIHRPGPDPKRMHSNKYEMLFRPEHWGPDDEKLDEG